MNLESLQSRRAWLAGGAVVAVLLIAASYFLVILPKLGSASDTRNQARDNDLANTRLVARHGALARQEHDVAGLRADLSAALDALPPTTAIPQFTHEVTRAATAAGVTLQNIGIGTPAQVMSTSVTPTSTTTPTATATASSAATATAAPAAAASQYQLSVTLATSGPVKNQLAFVRAIENGPRRALFTSTSFSGTGSKMTLTSQLNVFTAPMSDQQVAQLRKLLVAG